MRIIVYAAPEVLIKSYQALAAELDFKIIAIDYNGNSVYQYLNKQSHTQMDLYLQINERNSLFTILDHGVLALQRNMNFGTDTLIDSMLYEGLFEEINAQEAMLKLVQEDLLYHSFLQIGSFIPEDDEEMKLHEIKKQLTDVVRPLIGNISRVLEYYNMKKRDIKISTIFIGGVGAKVQGLKELMENEFQGLEFIIVNQLQGITISKKDGLGSLRSTEFMACIGASYPTINFHTLVEKENITKEIAIGLGALFVVILASILIVFNGKMEYKEAVQEKERLQERINELSSIIQIENEYNQAMNLTNEIFNADASTYSFHEEWEEIITNLETELPRESVINSLSSSESGLTMNVVSTSKEEAAKFLLQMKKIPYFSSVSINGITEQVDTETGMVTVMYSVMCTYQRVEDAEGEADNE